MKNQLKEILATTLRLIRNKGVAVLVLAGLIYGFKHLPSGESGATAFSELLYAFIMIAAIIVVGPIVRLLVFPAAAEFVEGGDMKKELKHFVLRDAVPPTTAMRHYWFATTVSYAVVLLCVSSLLRL